MNNIEAVLHAADGKIVGKIRMQKIFYLLEALGMRGGYSYTYLHYGPFSQGVANQIDAARLFSKTIKEESNPGAYGNAYSVFSLAEQGAPPVKVGQLDFDRAKEYISKMKAVTSVVLELAATIYWLKNEEKLDDWRNELISRKPQKATDENIQKAETLLVELELTR